MSAHSHPAAPFWERHNALRRELQLAKWRRSRLDGQPTSPAPHSCVHWYGGRCPISLCSLVRLGAAAAEEAARVSARLESERSAWEADLAAHEAEADELRAAVARSREAATAAQDALEAAMGAHRAEIDERDRQAARAEARHGEETNRLARELDEARVGLAAALARADAADHRAAAAEHAARTGTEQMAEADAAMGRLKIELATAQAARDAAAQRAERAEGLVEQTRAELAAERDRHDVSLAELHDQLAQLLARQPAGPQGTKRAR